MEMMSKKEYKAALREARIHAKSEKKKRRVTELLCRNLLIIIKIPA